MDVTLCHFPLGYKGVANAVFDKALKGIPGPDYSGVLYLAPTALMVDERQRVFHGRAGRCYIPPQMATPLQFTKTLCSMLSGKSILSPGGLTPLVISRLSGKGMGLSSIIADFISEIKQHYPRGPSEQAMDAITEAVEKLGIPEEVSSRIFEALDVLKQYDALLEAHGLMDGDDTLLLAPQIIMERLSPPPKVLVLDGFQRATNAERAVFSALISRSEKTVISICTDSAFSDVSKDFVDYLKSEHNPEEICFEGPEGAISAPVFHSFPSAEEEVEGIARHIKSSFMSGRLKDLSGVVAGFPNVELCRDMVSRVFTKYGVPHSVQTPLRASEGEACLDMLGMLEAVADDYPRLPFSRFLMSRHFTDIPPALRQAAPGVSLSSGIIKGRELWLNAFKQAGVEVAEDGGKVFKRLRKLEKIRNKANFEDYVSVLQSLLDSFGFSPQGPNGQAVLDALQEALRGIRQLQSLSAGGGGGGGQTDLRGFMEALRRLLETVFVDDEAQSEEAFVGAGGAGGAVGGGVGQGSQPASGVRVMSLAHCGGLEPEFLYLGGLKDGDIPSMPVFDMLLPDGVRTRLGLLNLSRHLHAEEFSFRRLISPAQNEDAQKSDAQKGEGKRGVFLSYPSMEGDTFFLPSVFLSGATEKSGQVYGIFSEEERQLRDASRVPFTRHIREVSAMKAAGAGGSGKSSIYVTDIDYYRSCPRRFFILKLLKLEPPEKKEFEVEPRVLGTILHEVMEGLFIPEEPLGTLDALTERAASVLDQVLSKQPVDRYWRELIKESFLFMLPDIYEAEQKIADEGYVFWQAEQRVQGEPLRGISLRGKIDRLDCPKEDADPGLAFEEDGGGLSGAGQGRRVSVIDYKSGSASLSASGVLKRGSALQLPLYAALLKKKGFSPERVGVYSLRDASVSWLPNKTDVKKGIKLDTYMEASLAYLQDTVRQMKKGSFPADPLEDHTCRLCPERPYCPYIQGKGD